MWLSYSRGLWLVWRIQLPLQIDEHLLNIIVVLIERSQIRRQSSFCWLVYFVHLYLCDIANKWVVKWWWFPLVTMVIYFLSLFITIDRNGPIRKSLQMRKTMTYPAETRTCSHERRSIYNQYCEKREWEGCTLGDNIPSWESEEEYEWCIHKWFDIFKEMCVYHMSLPVFPRRLPNM